MWKRFSRAGEARIGRLWEGRPSEAFGGGCVGGPPPPALVAKTLTSATGAVGGQASMLD